ncbi:Eukaryotic translation initiation factor 2-alpha kinase [Mortierella hygrophila]|uniref:Eukaryotic translation initiation factor 2-alpha kinase 1 n=1 Tax=Mortierella hygrophila TaxID=979708 RepID=A0A9P6EYX0_9FUNG|nr:Eukaryotic translation initiation factor 2-alpha kinase [Mortierella hygrophila]
MLQGTEMDRDEPFNARSPTEKGSPWPPRRSESLSPRSPIGRSGPGPGPEPVPSTVRSPTRIGSISQIQDLSHSPFQSPVFNPPRRERRMMRNTTVMTLHSDSESDYEDIQDFGRRQQDSEFMDETIIFDNGLSSINAFDRAEINSSRHSQSSDATDTGPTTRTRRFVWRGIETSGDDQTTTDEDTTMDPVDMFNQDSDMDQGGSDEDQGIENDNEDGAQRFGLNNNALGSYLLAPMGFDDDDDPGTSPAVSGYVEAAERFQIFAGVKEFDESDQIGLEDRAYEVIPKSKRRDQERIMENKRRQGKLLLVSLLDNFCLLYDQSPERNRKLFYVICKTLSNMGIIDEEYLEEMSAVRSSYQRAFRSLVLSALTSIKKEQIILESRSIMAPPSTPTEGSQQNSRGSRSSDINSRGSFSDSFSSRGIISASNHLHTPPVDNTTFPTTAMMRTLSFGDMFDNDPTRYKHDFVEIGKLGKGGFASVFKARNKLDGIEYAIKKIRLRGGAKVRYEKIFREIKFLARLDHKNVIRYYSSWLEHADYPVSRREMYGNGDLDTNGDVDEYDDDYGDEDEYTNTMSMSVSVREDEMASPVRNRRPSVDYFGPHAEQHSTDPEDLSMGIVFGDDGDGSDGCEIDFESAARLNDSVEGEINLHEPGRILNFGGIGESYEGEDMERTHSASSTLTSRSIPGAAKKSPQQRKHKSPTVSQEMQGRTPTWEYTEDDSRNSRSGLSNSYSALSSSIEEIQRSLPDSYSSSGLGSRYGQSQSGGHELDPREDELGLRPFSYPHRRGPNGKDFVGGGIGGLHGVGSSRSDNSQRGLRNSTGQLITRDLTLFIQMQLCQTTLQDYLVYRNERPVPITKKPIDQLTRKLSKKDRFGILATASDPTDQTTHSTPGSPLQQTCHKELVDQAANQHIFRAIVEGVAYIHDQDMIHRDLKPSNIFLGMPPGAEHMRAQQQQQQARQDQCSLDSDLAQLAGVTSAGLLTNFGAAIGGVSEPSDSSSQCRLTKEQEQEELFMNIENMVPKIGDFGLVTDQEGGATMGKEESQDTSSIPSSSQASSSDRPLMRRQSSAATSGSRSSRTRTTAVGTVTYASPEQLARPNLGYDQKADIYSLGIIFFELYHPFSTLMERHAVLRTLRNGELPPEFVSRWPKEAAFVLWLMAEDPRMRPSAREILEFDMIRKAKEEAMNVSQSSTPTENDISSGSSRRGPGQRAEGRQKEDLYGLGLLTETGVSKPKVSSLKGKSICEACQARCRCSSPSNSSRPSSASVVPSSDPSGFIDPSMPGTGVSIEAESITPKPKSKDTSKRFSSSSHGRGHRSSKSTSMSQKLSRSELEHKLTEETERSKRLEMSLEAMRAEQKALLDRIQALEYEKDLSWRGGAYGGGGGSKGPVDDDDEL